MQCLSNDIFHHRSIVTHGVPVLPLQELTQPLFSGEGCCALTWYRSFTVLKPVVGSECYDTHLAKYSPLG